MSVPDGDDPGTLAELFRPWHKLAGAVVLQAWREVERRRLPLGTRDTKNHTSAETANRVRMLSYLSAVRTLLHPRGFWVELLEIDRKVLATEVARVLLHHYGEERARLIARWAVDGNPPTTVPAWWHHRRREGTPNG